MTKWYARTTWHTNIANDVCRLVEYNVNCRWLDCCSLRHCIWIFAVVSVRVPPYAFSRMLCCGIERHRRKLALNTIHKCIFLSFKFTKRVKAQSPKYNAVGRCCFIFAIIKSSIIERIPVFPVAVFHSRTSTSSILLFLWVHSIKWIEAIAYVTHTRITHIHTHTHTCSSYWRRHTIEKIMK